MDKYSNWLINLMENIDSFIIDFFFGHPTHGSAATESVAKWKSSTSSTLKIYCSLERERSLLMSLDYTRRTSGW